MLKFEFLDQPLLGNNIAEAIIGVSELNKSSLYYIPTDYWSRENYVKHWLLAINELQTNGKSAFLLLADEIGEDESVECYKAWKSGNAYIFQHDGLYQYEIDEPIDINIPWQYIENEPSDELDEINISNKDVEKLKASLNEYLLNIGSDS